LEKSLNEKSFTFQVWKKVGKGRAGIPKKNPKKKSRKPVIENGRKLFSKSEGVWGVGESRPNGQKKARPLKRLL